MQSFIKGARAVVSKLRPKPKHGLRKSARMLSSGTGGSSPVCSYNEWDSLEEIIVGRAEGMRVPYLHPNLKAKTTPEAWKWFEEHANEAHDPAIVAKATKEVNEFVRVLEMEGVKVRRPEPIMWDELGSFKTPFYEDGGHMNTTPRDGILVVGDEIIEAAMAWRSRMFEFYPYRRLFNEYFKQGASWTAAPSPTKRDELYVKDFPYEDEETRTKWANEGQYILTEEEVAFDAADVARCGTDIFISISNATNRSGVEWLRRHLGPKGYRVHSFIYKGNRNVHADVSLIPLRPGVVMVNPFYHLIKMNDKPDSWDWFVRHGWEVIEAPESVVLCNEYTGVYVSQWIYMNTLSLDEERVIIQKGETLLKDKLESNGFKPIEVDFRSAVHLGGAFHCWTCDIRRRGTKETYFEL